MANSENIENLILEHLKALRNELQTFRTETRENFEQVKARLQSLEERAVLTERGLVNVPATLP